MIEEAFYYIIGCAFVIIVILVLVLYFLYPLLELLGIGTVLWMKSEQKKHDEKMKVIREQNKVKECDRWEKIIKCKRKERLKAKKITQTSIKDNVKMVELIRGIINDELEVKYNDDYDDCYELDLNYCGTFDYEQWKREYKYYNDVYNECGTTVHERNEEYLKQAFNMIFQGIEKNRQK